MSLKKIYESDRVHLTQSLVYDVSYTLRESFDLVGCSQVDVKEYCQCYTMLSVSREINTKHMSVV